jgi:hypothetical protein
MFYKKNVAAIERILRLIVGCCLILCGMLAFKGMPLGWVLAGSGVLTMVTGVIGFCPACAMAGRRAVGDR